MTALLALPVVALLGVLAGLRIARRRRAQRAAREWAATCARWPWRVAAVLDGGPLMMHLGDDVLRLWWEGEGRAKYPELAAMEATTKGPRP